MVVLWRPCGQGEEFRSEREGEQRLYVCVWTPFEPATDKSEDVILSNLCP